MTPLDGLWLGMSISMALFVVMLHVFGGVAKRRLAASERRRADAEVLRGLRAVLRKEQELSRIRRWDMPAVDRVREWQVSQIVALGLRVPRPTATSP